jgi:hypothetical protein
LLLVPVVPLPCRDIVLQNRTAEKLQE